jgi:glyoxylase-like metal-dependent hydrolase (beta-lactamase superfamily II)
MAICTDLGRGLFSFDLLEMGITGRTSAYLYAGDATILIETGSALSHERIVAALGELQRTPADLDAVIVTHVHLDHAGGAGTLARVAPQAEFLAHPRAARHLADPSRLLAGARTVYGERLTELFGDVLPVASDRVTVQEDGTERRFGPLHLRFHDTPGHARHHMSIEDVERRALFSGDALGIRYVREFTGWDFEFIFPSTSPADFDPLAMRSTIARIARLGLETVYHTHFGPSPAAQALAATSAGVDTVTAFIREHYRPGMDPATLIAPLQHAIARHLVRHGIVARADNLDMQRLGIDLPLDAMGLCIYAARDEATRTH